MHFFFKYFIFPLFLHFIRLQTPEVSRLKAPCCNYLLFDCLLNESLFFELKQNHAVNEICSFNEQYLGRCRVACNCSLSLFEIRPVLDDLFNSKYFILT